MRHTRLSVREQAGASRCSQATSGFGAGYSAAAAVSIVVLAAALVASSLFAVLP